MRTAPIVKIEIACQRLPDVGDCLVAVQVNLFILDRFPEPLNEDVVPPTTLAIHAVAECQKRGGIAAIVDAEHAFDRFYAEALGVDVNNLLNNRRD